MTNKTGEILVSYSGNEIDQTEFSKFYKSVHKIDKEINNRDHYHHDRNNDGYHHDDDDFDRRGRNSGRNDRRYWNGDEANNHIMRGRDSNGMKPDRMYNRDHYENRGYEGSRSPTRYGSPSRASSPVRYGGGYYRSGGGL